MVVKGGASWSYFPAWCCFSSASSSYRARSGALHHAGAGQYCAAQSQADAADRGIGGSPSCRHCSSGTGSSRSAARPRHARLVLGHRQPMRPLSSDLLPSHWIAEGLHAAAVGDLATAGYYLALVWSNGLFLYVVTVWAQQALSARLQPHGFGGVAPQKVWRPLARSRRGPRPVFSRCPDETAHHQGFSFVSPRPRPVVPDLHLPAAVGPVFLEHAQLLRAGHRHEVPEPHQSADPAGHRFFDLCLHRAASFIRCSASKGASSGSWECCR